MTPGSFGRLTAYEIIIWRCTRIHSTWIFLFLSDSFMWGHFFGQNWIRSLSVSAAFLLLYLLACRSKHINGAWENSQLESWHHIVCYWVFWFSPSYTSNVDSSWRARLRTNEEKTFLDPKCRLYYGHSCFGTCIKIFKRLRKNTKNNHML